MSDTRLKNKGNTKVIVAVSVLIILALSWFTFSKPKTQDDSIMKYDNPDLSATDKKILETLSSVGNIDIDPQVLEDPAFRLLQDRSRQITEEPIGRANPFAPIDPNAILEAQSTSLNTENNSSAAGSANNTGSNGVNLQPREEN